MGPLQLKAPPVATCTAPSGHECEAEGVPPHAVRLTRADDGPAQGLAVSWVGYVLGGRIPHRFLPTLTVAGCCSAQARVPWPACGSPAEAACPMRPTKHEPQHTPIHAWPHKVRTRVRPFWSSCTFTRARPLSRSWQVLPHTCKGPKPPGMRCQRQHGAVATQLQVLDWLPAQRV
jgi:hypothetical protein